MSAQAHPERVPDLSWSRREEPYLVPVPAARYTEAELYGRRVTLHDPVSRCWRYDVMAVVGPYRQDGADLVGVVDAHDFYRARRERVQIPTTAVPVDRLWCDELHEDLSDVDDDLIPPVVDIPPQQPHLPPNTFRVDPRRPPLRRCLRGNRVASVSIGARIIRSTPGGLIRGFRVISQPHIVEHPGPNLHDLDLVNVPLFLQCYTICSEAEFYAWVPTGTTPPHAHFEQCGAVFFE